MSKYISSFNTTSTTENVIFNNNVGIGVTNPSQKLDINGDALIQGGDLYLVDTNESISSNGTDMFFTVGGSEIVRFEAGGNVGIGVTNPSALLDINGNINIGTTIAATNLTLTDGAINGYILRTDGSGNASWVDINLVNSQSIADTDTNTSITTELNPDENIIRFSTAGTERMVIGSTGYIGIGSATPGALLSLGNSVANTKLAIYDGGSVFGGFGYQASQFRIHVAGATDDFLFLDATAGNELMRLEGTGNLGIGVTNPSQKLDINGDALIQGGDLYLVDTNESISSNGTDMFFTVGGSEIVRFGSTGNVGIGTNNPSEKLEVRGTNTTIRIHDPTNFLPQIHFTRGTSTGYGSSVFADWLIGVVDANFIIQSKYNNGANGKTALTAIFDTGNVGIGVTNPSQKLDINGDALIQGGDLYLIDTNEKIASDGTDMFFHVGGSETVRFGSTGNVGIGTNNPDAKLDIVGSTKHRGNIRSVVEEITSNTTLDHTHSIIMVGTTGGNVTITLPVSHDGTAEPNFIGSEFKIIKKGAINTVTIVRGGSDLIDGASTSVTLTGDRDRILLVNSGGANSIGEWHSF